MPSKVLSSSFFSNLVYSRHQWRFLAFLCFSDSERSQIVHVTFKDPQGAETAVLLSVCFCQSQFIVHFQKFADYNYN